MEPSFSAEKVIGNFESAFSRLRDHNCLSLYLKPVWDCALLPMESLCSFRGANISNPPFLGGALNPCWILCYRASTRGLYRISISPRLGRSSSKGQYAFFYRFVKESSQSLEWNLHFTKWNFVLTAGKMFCLSMTLTFMMMVMKVLESILSRENRTLYAFSPRLLVSEKRIMSWWRKLASVMLSFIKKKSSSVALKRELGVWLFISEMILDSLHLWATNKMAPCCPESAL